MNCTSCGKPLATGIPFCPACGAPTPYNMSGQGSPSPYDPAQASSPEGSQNYPPLPPTLAANSNNYPPQNPYTNYGPGMPPPAPYNPYNTPPDYPRPPQSPTNPSGYGPYYNPTPIPGYPPGAQLGANAVLPKKRRKVGLIIGISLLALVLLCGGLIVAVTLLGKSATTSSRSSNNTTTAPGSVPTNSDVVPTAAKILFGVQTSSAINSNYDPTHVTTTFATGKYVNLTFHVDSLGKNGYIKVRWYENGQEVDSNILAHHAQNDHGYFGESFTSAGSGNAALYWCTKSDCSDEQLAQVVGFTITGTGAMPSRNNIVAATDWKHNTD